MADFVKVEGLDEIVARLRALPAEVSGKGGGPLRKALAAAAALVRDDARAHAPVDTGALKENIIMYRDRNPESIGANEHYKVGVRRIKFTRKVRSILRRVRKAGANIRIREETFYWRFLEFGTSKMRARPFMRPAFDNNKGAINAIFIETLDKGIYDAVKKLGGK